VSTSERHQPDEPRHARSPHRGFPFAALLVMGGGFALILYIHGARWWYAPLAMVGIVLAHMTVLGGVVFAATRARRGRVAHRGTTCCQARAGHSHHTESILLHKPLQFDLLTKVCTLGRERKLRQWTLDLADLQPENVVLDVGCGTGTLLLGAAERVGPSGALHGIEPSKEMAARARHKAEAHQVPLEVVEGSADNLPYPPASFDAIFCTLVFHHLPRLMQEDAVREMRRVLRPGGRAVIVDWQRPRSFTRAIISPLFLVYLLHFFGPSRSPLDAPGIETLMRELGFEDIARCSYGAGGGVGAVVARLAPGASALDREEPQDKAPVRTDA